MSKPTVQYDRAVVVLERESAVLSGVTTHPNHLDGHNVRNDPTSLVWTSPVVAYDQATGRIETRNTIYERREPKAS